MRHPSGGKEPRRDGNSELDAEESTGEEGRAQEGGGQEITHEKGAGQGRGDQDRGQEGGPKEGTGQGGRQEGSGQEGGPEEGSGQGGGGVALRRDLPRPAEGAARRRARDLPASGRRPAGRGRPARRRA